VAQISWVPWPTDKVKFNYSLQVVRGILFAIHNATYSKIEPSASDKSLGWRLFVYRDAQSELSLTFRWDGAGLSSSGDIILFEEEKPPFQAIHIHGHLSRLLLMIRAGEPVTKLIWIVPDSWYSELDRMSFRTYECGKIVSASDSRQ
jgi:hypothetical protein